MYWYLYSVTESPRVNCNVSLPMQHLDPFTYQDSVQLAGSFRPPRRLEDFDLASSRPPKVLKRDHAYLSKLAENPVWTSFFLTRNLSKQKGGRRPHYYFDKLPLQIMERVLALCAAKDIKK